MTRLAFVVALSLLGACGGQGIKTGETGDNSAGGSLDTGGAMGGSGVGAAGGGLADATGGSTGSGSNAGPLVSPCRPAPTCPPGWYAYEDSICPRGSPTCSSNGDGLCYQRCTHDADCDVAPSAKCGSINVFGGSDYGRPTGVCKSAPAVSACPVGAGGTGDTSGTGGHALGGQAGGSTIFETWSGGGSGGFGGVGGGGGGGAGGGAGGTWSESWTTVAFKDGRAAPYGIPSQPPNGYGWVAVAPPATLVSPVCDGAPITASSSCSHTPDWPSTQELCISGSIPADPGNDGQQSLGVMVGLNVTEPFGGVLGVAYVRTFVTLSGSPVQGLRLVVHRSGDPEGTTYCVPVTNIERIEFTSFNTKCWDDSGIALRPEDVPNLDRIALQVPSTGSPIAIDDLCLSGLYLQ